ncbi:MAG TPA: cell division protein FtsB [Gammaproteobacteria bacterium]|nr:cell division protein FtsB [Gammaproteobacteria bacterium]
MRLNLLIAILIFLLVVLHWQIWIGHANVFDAWRLARAVAEQKAENARLRERNAALEAEVADLKQGFEAIEERARTELGMVKKGETFYQIVEEEERVDGTPPSDEAAPRKAGNVP